IYEAIEGPFMPKALGLVDEEELRVLVLEDLSEAHWPPPYPGDTKPLFAAIDEVAAVAPPVLPPLRPMESWASVLADPEPFLGLALCSRAWLDEAGPVLVAAAAEAGIDGDRLVHNDIWSENLCFVGGRAVLVDWAVSRVGNPDLDRGFALLSIHAEGGRVP